MNFTFSGNRAFTLVELLVTIGILAAWSAWPCPPQEKAESGACAANLRQIGLASQLYANDHEQNFPMIEAWPSNPVYESRDGATTILEALGPSGLTTASMKCQSDISGPNYYRKEGSSYQ